MIRAALIGTGNMGLKYLKMINDGKVPSLNVTAAVARSERSVKSVRDICGGNISVFKDEDDLYKSGSLFDAVLIVTPHRLHPAMALRALENGKHILVDKPVGVSVYQCKDLTEKSRNTELKFSVIFHQREYEKYKKIKEILEQGHIGKIYRVLMENTRYFRTEYYHRSGKWRSSWSGEGGGCLINQGQHILDIWQWLFGMPESVLSRISFGKYNNFSVDDEAVLFMKYPDDMSGVFILTTGEGDRKERLEITGSKGYIHLSGDKLILGEYSRDLDEYRADVQNNAREELSEKITEWELPVNEEPYAAILENFALSCENKAELTVNGLSAINALELTNAAYLSAWLDREIFFPVDCELYESELNKRIEEEYDAAKQADIFEDKAAYYAVNSDDPGKTDL